MFAVCTAPLQQPATARPQRVDGAGRGGGAGRVPGDGGSRECAAAAAKEEELVSKAVDVVQRCHGVVVVVVVVAVVVAGDGGGVRASSGGPRCGRQYVRHPHPLRPSCAAPPASFSPRFRERRALRAVVAPSRTAPLIRALLEPASSRFLILSVGLRSPRALPALARSRVCVCSICWRQTNFTSPVELHRSRFAPKCLTVVLALSR